MTETAVMKWAQNTQGESEKDESDWWEELKHDETIERDEEGREIRKGCGRRRFWR